MPLSKLFFRKEVILNAACENILTQIDTRIHTPGPWLVCVFLDQAKICMIQIRMSEVISNKKGMSEEIPSLL